MVLYKLLGARVPHCNLVKTHNKQEAVCIGEN